MTKTITVDESEMQIVKMALRNKKERKQRAFETYIASLIDDDIEVDYNSPVYKKWMEELKQIESLMKKFTSQN